MMLGLRLSLADHLDRWEARLRQTVEPLGFSQGWLRDFRLYLGDPRLTLGEFWGRYALKRQAVQPILASPMTLDEALRFYGTNDYLLWRQIVHRRHSAWRRVLVTMPERLGRLLEFGCGIAPVSTWLRPRRPRWSYALEDVPSPHLAYGQWRVPSQARFRSSREARDCHLIVALDVFEHLPDPEATARDLVRRLELGGSLHWNFVAGPAEDLNLATPVQREATRAFLLNTLDLVWQSDDHVVSRKPWY